MAIIDWAAFGRTLRRKQRRYKRIAPGIGIETGLTTAQVERALAGKPVSAPVYVVLCKWANYHPGRFLAS